MISASASCFIAGKTGKSRDVLPLDVPYYFIGWEPSGKKHASRGSLGPAICDATLEWVHDRRHYTDDEIAVLDICADCHAIARLTKSLNEPALEWHENRGRVASRSLDMHPVDRA
jgi:hypothetical protein